MWLCLFQEPIISFNLLISQRQQYALVRMNGWVARFDWTPRRRRTCLKLPLRRCSQSIMSWKMGIMTFLKSGCGTSVTSRKGPIIAGMKFNLCSPVKGGRAETGWSGIKKQTSDQRSFNFSPHLKCSAAVKASVTQPERNKKLLLQAGVRCAGGLPWKQKRLIFFQSNATDLHIQFALRHKVLSLFLWTESTSKAGEAHLNSATCWRSHIPSSPSCPHT